MYVFALVYNSPKITLATIVLIIYDKFDLENID